MVGPQGRRGLKAAEDYLCSVLAAQCSHQVHQLGGCVGVLVDTGRKKGVHTAGRDPHPTGLQHGQWQLRHFYARVARLQASCERESR